MSVIGSTSDPNAKCSQICEHFAFGADVDPMQICEHFAFGADVDPIMDIGHVVNYENNRVPLPVPIHFPETVSVPYVEDKACSIRAAVGIARSQTRTLESDAHPRIVDEGSTACEAPAAEEIEKKI